MHSKSSLTKFKLRNSLSLTIFLIPFNQNLVPLRGQRACGVDD